MWLVGTHTVPGNLPFRLCPGEFIVGRTKRAQIVIADETVSRRHARLVYARSAIMLYDLGSTNGTFLNDCPISQCELRIGDQVRFGYVPCGLSSSPLLIPPTDDEERTHKVRKASDQTTHVGMLTAAQQEIVDHVLKGSTEAEIANRLGKSTHTIHTHLKAIFQRVGVHSRAELILTLLKRK